MWEEHLPPSVPGISLDCKECGRTVHFIRRGENGEGIKVESRRTVHHSGRLNTLSWSQSQMGSCSAQVCRSPEPVLRREDADGGSMLEFVEEVERTSIATSSSTEGCEKGWFIASKKTRQSWSVRLERTSSRAIGTSLPHLMFCGGIKWSIENPTRNGFAWRWLRWARCEACRSLPKAVFEETAGAAKLPREVVCEAAAAAGNRGNLPN